MPEIKGVYVTAKSEEQEFKIFDEKDCHKMLCDKGFHTNYNKVYNENGYDIIAIKNGAPFLIEHKKLELRRDKTYRYSGEIKGDIAMMSTPKGNWFFMVNEKTSLTKTARLLDLIFK